MNRRTSPRLALAALLLLAWPLAQSAADTPIATTLYKEGAGKIEGDLLADSVKSVAVDGGTVTVVQRDSATAESTLTFATDAVADGSVTNAKLDATVARVLNGAAQADGIDIDGSELRFAAEDGTITRIALPTGGLNQAAVDARVAAGTKAAARAGSTARWTASEIPTLASLGLAETDGDWLGFERTTVLRLSSGHAATLVHDTGLDLAGDEDSITITMSGLSGSETVSVPTLLALPDVPNGTNLLLASRTGDAHAFTLQSRQFYLTHAGDNIGIADGQVADQRDITLVAAGRRLEAFADRQQPDAPYAQPRLSPVLSSAGNVKFGTRDGQVTAHVDLPTPATNYEALASGAFVPQTRQQNPDIGSGSGRRFLDASFAHDGTTFTVFAVIRDGVQQSVELLPVATRNKTTDLVLEVAGVDYHFAEATFYSEGDQAGATYNDATDNADAYVWRGSWPALPNPTEWEIEVRKTPVDLPKPADPGDDGKVPTAASGAYVLRTPASVPTPADPQDDGEVLTAQSGAFAWQPLRVRSADIVDGAVELADMDANSVGAAQIEDGAVTGPKLAAAAVTTAKVADAAITRAKLAPDALASAIPKISAFPESPDEGERAEALVDLTWQTVGVLRPAALGHGNTGWAYDGRTAIGSLGPVAPAQIVLLGWYSTDSHNNTALQGRLVVERASPTAKAVSKIVLDGTEHPFAAAANLPAFRASSATVANPFASTSEHVVAIHFTDGSLEFGTVAVPARSTIVFAQHNWGLSPGEWTEAGLERVIAGQVAAWSLAANDDALPDAKRGVFVGTASQVAAAPVVEGRLYFEVAN